MTNPISPKRSIEKWGKWTNNGIIYSILTAVGYFGWDALPKIDKASSIESRIDILESNLISIGNTALTEEEFFAICEYAKDNNKDLKSMSEKECISILNDLDYMNRKRILREGQ